MDFLQHLDAVENPKKVITGYSVAVFPIVKTIDKMKILRMNNTTNSDLFCQNLMCKEFLYYLCLNIFQVELKKNFTQKKRQY